MSDGRLDSVVRRDTSEKIDKNKPTESYCSQGNKVSLTNAKNVLGTQLKSCSFEPMTGFYRNGCCETGPDDYGLHTICVHVNAEFLAFQVSVGNNLSTPNAAYGFPGLKPGDFWCVCVTRWKQAYEAGVIAKVDLEASHMSVLEFVDLETLQKYAVKRESKNQ